MNTNKFLLCLCNIRHSRSQDRVKKEGYMKNLNIILFFVELDGICLFRQHFGRNGTNQNLIDLIFI